MSTRQQFIVKDVHSTSYVNQNYYSHLIEGEYNYLDQQAWICEINWDEPMKVKRMGMDSCDDQVMIAWAPLQTVIQTGQ
jgi:hypothetical protein